MNKEFREYVRMLISEIMEENSLPTASQLVSLNKGEAPLDKDKDKDKDLEEDKELDEFSAGGVAGSPGAQLVLPLGKSPKGVKRKNPSWA
jgi:hypothetical protein